MVATTRRFVELWATKRDSFADTKLDINRSMLNMGKSLRDKLKQNRDPLTMWRYATTAVRRSAAELTQKVHRKVRGFNKYVFEVEGGVARVKRDWVPWSSSKSDNPQLLEVEEPRETPVPISSVCKWVGVLPLSWKGVKSKKMCISEYFTDFIFKHGYGANLPPEQTYIDKQIWSGGYDTAMENFRVMAKPTTAKISYERLQLALERRVQHIKLPQMDSLTDRDVYGVRI